MGDSIYLAHHNFRRGFDRFGLQIFQRYFNEGLSIILRIRVFRCSQDLQSILGKTRPLNGVGIAARIFFEDHALLLEGNGVSLNDFAICAKVFSCEPLARKSEGRTKTNLN